MSKCFMLQFPDNFPATEKNSLCELVYSYSFLELMTYTDKNRREFLFDNDAWSAGKLRSTFKIPPQVKIIDTSDWFH